MSKGCSQMKVEVPLPLNKDDGMQQCRFESNAQC